MSQHDRVNRRDFVRSAVAGGALAAAAPLAAQGPVSSGARSRPEGANDRINVGLIGAGGRGSTLLRLMMMLAEERGGIQVTAVCDVWEKRKRRAQAAAQAGFATLDYRELLARPDLDAVVIATPDHWHGRMALEAMEAGKDVYLEKPMCHTIEEAQAVVRKVNESGRVLQVGSQTTSSQQWWKARKAIADGMIGELINSQGSYHRNSQEGEWNWDIDRNAGPHAQGENYIDWKMWLGPAPERPWDPERYFRFRKFWDYSGGIATDLFYHVVAPLNICWPQPQFPRRVTASGGIYAFPDREVPDTFNLLADFEAGHSLVLSSSMANGAHIPGLIRGHKGTITMVDHGRFEGRTDHITVSAEGPYRDEFVSRWGYQSVDIPVDPIPRGQHLVNFFDCVRSRNKPVLDAETAYRAQVAISMSVRAYREGRVLYFDPAQEKVVYEPPKKA